MRPFGYGPSTPVATGILWVIAWGVAGLLFYFSAQPWGRTPLTFGDDGSRWLLAWLGAVAIWFVPHIYNRRDDPFSVRTNVALRWLYRGIYVVLLPTTTLFAFSLWSTLEWELHREDLVRRVALNVASERREVKGRGNRAKRVWFSRYEYRYSGKAHSFMQPGVAYEQAVQFFPQSPGIRLSPGANWRLLTGPVLLLGLGFMVWKWVRQGVWAFPEESVGLRGPPPPPEVFVQAVDGVVTCVFCRETILGGEARVVCVKCGAWLHEECKAQAKCCPTIGCEG